MKRFLFLSLFLFTVFFSCTVVAQIWQIQNSNFPDSVMVTDFSAVNNQICWAVGQKYPQNTNPYAGYIRTTNGGDTWICDTIPGIPDGYFQIIFAIDADTAYATVYVQSGENSKGIYKTTNAGTTWNRQNAYNASLYGPAYIHFFDAQNGVVIGDPNIETYTTSNGGLTWNPVSMPPALPDEVTWLNGTSITASGNTVWFGTGARIYKSTDKGYNWTILISEPQYILWNPSIAFQNSLIGIYSLKKQGNATDHLYRRTIDGGINWDIISNSILDNIAPTSLQHIPGTVSTYVLSGGRNTGMNGTAVTHDAGLTWSLIENVGNLHIVFPSYTVGWGSQYFSNVVQKYIGPPLIVPVELTSFTALINGKEVILNWSTATEINNQGFEIQRSTEGKEFFTVGFVNGHGTTTEQQNYSYADRNLDGGKYFYRLKQVDFDGSYEYSDVVEIEITSPIEFTLEQNYPNPFNPTTTIGFSIQNKSNVKIKVLNSIGEEVAVILNEEKEAGIHQVEFNAANLPSGVYFYQIKAGSFVETKKMVLMK
jgi:photosystem II stability/assembly factor-like uncharacterized protein